MDVTETEYDDMNWSHLIQDTAQWQIPANKIMKCPVPYEEGIVLSYWCKSSVPKVISYTVRKKSGAMPW
jgi:hypothetical protein